MAEIDALITLKNTPVVPWTPISSPCGKSRGKKGYVFSPPASALWTI